MEAHQKKVGDALRTRRKAKQWSQEKAAQAVGVSTSTWGDWERGKHNPYDSNWLKIEEAFGIDAREIRGEPPTPLVLVGSDSSARVGDLHQISKELAEIRAGIARIENTLAADPVKPPGADNPPKDVEEVESSPRLGDLGSKRRAGPKGRRGTDRA